MLNLIIWVLTATASPSDVAAFQRFAPQYLTTDTARDHLVSARYAGLAYDLDPDLLLSVAWFESRYTPAVVGPNVNGKHACGIMQPLMHGSTCPTQTLVAGYLEGAEHLRTWLDTKTCRGNLHCALLGYGGGYHLLKQCNEGPVMVERSGRTVDLCHIVSDVRVATMRRIQRLRGRPPTT